MAVFAFCEKCDVRRDAARPGYAECNNKTAHKRYTAWVADHQLYRGGPRPRVVFGSDLENPRDLAEDQFRKWKTDFKQNQIVPVKRSALTTFAELIERYKTEHVTVHNRWPHRTFWRLDLLKSGLGKFLAGEITLEQIREFRKKVFEERGWAGSSANRVFNNTLHAVFEKGREWKILEKNPVEFLARMPETDPIPRFLEQSEIDSLFAAAPQRSLVDYMNVLLHTGARPISILECSWDNGDVDFGANIIWFTSYKGAKGKRHRYPVPIDDVLREILERRAKETGGKGSVFDTVNMRKLADKCVEDSKINEGRSADRRFTIYGLKHTFVSHLIMNGADLNDVRVLLGHTDSKMIQKHYGHLTIQHLRRVQNLVNLTPKPKQVQLKVI